MELIEYIQSTIDFQLETQENKTKLSKDLTSLLDSTTIFVAIQYAEYVRNRAEQHELSEADVRSFFRNHFKFEE